MLLKMCLHDSVGQREAGLEFLLYSDFLKEIQYFLWLCWNFSETVRYIKKRFGQGCRNSKIATLNVFTGLCRSKGDLTRIF